MEGAGQPAAYGGAGNDVFFTGTGDMTIVEGAGSDVVSFGAGNASVFGGAGTDLYAFSQGSAGGNDVISGFKVGTDQIGLYGYDPSTVQTQSTGGNTTLSLADGTQITLLGVSHLANGSVV